MKLLTLIALAGLASCPIVLSAESAAKPAAPPAVESKSYKNVGVEEFDKLRMNKTNVVLDVRTPKEFSDGHIPGAINIDWNGPDFEKKALALDKTKTYLVHCAAGVRSAKASERLAKLNFTSVINLEPGFNAWAKASKPIEKGESK